MADVDPGRVLSALGVQPPERVTPVVGGWDTLLWHVEAADKTSFALRVFRPDQAITWRREVLVMQALQKHGLPVPALSAYGMSDSRPAMLMSWCTGQPLLHHLMNQPWRTWSLGVALGRVHARIHRAPIDESLRQVSRRIEIGEPRASILHMDLHPLNVMTNGRVVTGVLDWANVAIGDPRVDLARTVTLLRLAPSPPGTPIVLLRPMRALLELAWRTGYTREHRSNPFRDLSPFCVWAAEWMERDLAPKLGKPGVWLQPADIARIHSWAAARRESQRPE